MNKSAKKRNPISVEVKKEIIAKFESGVKQVDLTSIYGLSKSTIATIIKNKETIKCATVAKGVTRFDSHRSSVHEEIEKILLVWINEMQMQGQSISQEIICEKAKRVFNDLREKLPGCSSEDDNFKASRGWFDRFRKRTGIHSIIRHGEAASADKQGAENYVKVFKCLIEDTGYLPEQVINCDETGLFWKKMPRRTYITMEEKALPGHKPSKDRITLLFAANASGDLKFKPLLVYHSETPRVFKKHSVDKSKLPIVWKSNRKAWVTQLLFKEWVAEVLAPTMKAYLDEKKLPMKALLCMDNAPGHPKGLQETLGDEFSFLKFEFLPANTTSILQSMDQHVIANFKKLYTKNLFKKCFDTCYGSTTMSLSKFWKEEFNIYQAIKIIDSSWCELSQRCLNSAWKKLCPAFVQEEEASSLSSDVMEEIVNTGKELGLEVDAEDVDELIEEHKDELTTDELAQMLTMQIKEEDDLSSGEQEEDSNSVVPTATIKDILQKWQEVQDLVMQWHPNPTEASRVLELCNDKAMLYFTTTLKKREKQTTLDRLFKCPPAKRQKTREQEDEDCVEEQGNE